MVRMIFKYHVVQNSTRQNFDELIVGFKRETIAGKGYETFDRFVKIFSSQILVLYGIIEQDYISKQIFRDSLKPGYIQKL